VVEAPPFERLVSKAVKTFPVWMGVRLHFERCGGVVRDGFEKQIRGRDAASWSSCGLGDLGGASGGTLRASSDEREEQADTDAERQSAPDLAPGVAHELLEPLMIDRSSSPHLVEENVESAGLAPDVLAQTSSFGNEIQAEDQADTEESAANA
jgi:hypothetical protein